MPLFAGIGAALSGLIGPMSESVVGSAAAVPEAMTKLGNAFANMFDQGPRVDALEDTTEAISPHVDSHAGRGMLTSTLLSRSASGGSGGSPNTLAALNGEVAALKAEMLTVRSEMAALREEVVELKTMLRQFLSASATTI